jgi:hypothetical protein
MHETRFDASQSGFPRVEAIRTYSNPGSVREKWADLRKRLREAPIRPPLSRDDSLPPRSKRLLGADDIADITARYDSGASTKKIADHYRVSRSRVSDLLRTQGVTLRRLGLTTDQVREAPILYAAGRSLAWLGVRYGVSPTTVSRALRGQRVQLRPRPGRL